MELNLSYTELIFKLESEELKASKEFIKDQMAKDDKLPTAGERFAYTFIPSGLGTMVSIKDLYLDEKKDITCWDWWG